MKLPLKYEQIFIHSHFSVSFYLSLLTHDLFREFVSTHITFDKDERQYKLKQDETLACKFLNHQNKCSIYSARPGTILLNQVHKE
jgi:Fe-S-cluster containining protein